MDSILQSAWSNSILTNNVFGDTLRPQDLLYSCPSEHSRRGQVVDCPQKVEVCLNICDYTPSDISVEIVDGEKAIRVSGKHDADAHLKDKMNSSSPGESESDFPRSRSFSEKYFLPATAKLSSMKKEFSRDNSHLIVTVMKKGYETADGTAYISGLRFKTSNSKLRVSSSTNCLSRDGSKLSIKDGSKCAVVAPPDNETSLPPLPVISEGVCSNNTSFCYAHSCWPSSTFLPVSDIPACATTATSCSDRTCNGVNWFTPSSKSLDGVNPYLASVPGALAEKYKLTSTNLSEHTFEKPDPAELEELLKRDFSSRKTC